MLPGAVAFALLRFVGSRSCAYLNEVVQVVQAIAEAGEVAMAREYAEAFGLSAVSGFDLSDDALAAAAARCVTGCVCLRTGLLQGGMAVCLMLSIIPPSF